MSGERATTLVEALAALSAEELRDFVGDALDRLDDGPRADLEDLLLQRAARSASGWKPAAPPSTFVEEATAFVAAARRDGQAEPSEVDHYLRQALTASLAGDLHAARTVFAALLGPIGNGDITLGQAETADEVLSANLHECTRQFVTAVYVTTPLAERADAVLQALDAAQGLAFVGDPLDEVAASLGGDVPEFVDFLPRWIARLEHDARPGGEWESPRERWLRAAVLRREGPWGLARLARATRQPSVAHAWCEALVAAGEWEQALRAFEECAALVRDSASRGDFLDGAALCARRLGTTDLVEKFEAAWLGAPSLPRLSRWLVSGAPSVAAVRDRAASALGKPPTRAPSLIGLLHLLTGELSDAARLLSEAPGLGWSGAEHPGPVLFPAFAWMLGDGPPGSLHEALSSALPVPTLSSPELSTPTPRDLLQRAGVMSGCPDADRRMLLEAMKTAATRRTKDLLREKRRGHYSQAALLVACCVALEPGTRTTAALPAWAEALRTSTSRYPAFQRELNEALGKALRRPSTD
ncbi:hypothetical protein LILAB_10100 [Corallococcus macrosporus]|uniref:Uncharacterized protein n=1 Tax=Myxococcus fulvus (strain ATCC BAA-855 / HW-1) TaxID=483219 RepID=F8CL18_MYXFH|nr:hypothetical protein LILAB_10100 [Corallococcus macrosporus]